MVSLYSDESKYQRLSTNQDSNVEFQGQSTNQDSNVEHLDDARWSKILMGKDLMTISNDYFFVIIRKV